MRFAKIFYYSLFAVLALTGAAQAASLAGTACNALGKIQTDTNNADVVACLQTSETDRALIWKTMTANGGLAGLDIKNAWCKELTGCMASCPKGKKVLGGGCWVNPGHGLITSSTPIGDNGWNCGGFSAGVYDGIGAIVVCASANGP